MRLCIAALTCLISITANLTLAQSDDSGTPPSLEKDPTVFIGEFEYAVSSLGKPSLGEVAGRNTLQTIATFISERQPLEPKHIQLLEEHREDLVHLLQHESRDAEAALILMWMNMQAGKPDSELAKHFAGIDTWRFLYLYRTAKSMHLLTYETFQQVMGARRLSGYDDPRHQIDDLQLFGLDRIEERLDMDHDLLVPGGWLKYREQWRREHLSPSARVDFKAALDVILDDTQTIQARKSKAAEILWEIIEFRDLGRERIDQLIDSRDHS